ncbi:AAA family ATPase [Pseudorhodoplanes sp.]|uniref:AAA family ATPase n=1 Tax=Pseudorhodoplanes sp. TaxID=1934341 RepID=UPI00391B8397
MSEFNAAYLDAAIRGEVDRMARAPEGDRNNSLFRASASLASLGLREGQIIHHLKPAAEFVGLRGKEFYATLKSGVRAGHTNPRSAVHLDANPKMMFQYGGTASATSKQRDRAPTDGGEPAFVVAGDEGPRVSASELRRHIYRRDGKPVRIKIKKRDGYINWYRASKEGTDGWLSRKPATYQACPYVGVVDPFDPNQFGELIYWPEGEKDCDTLGTFSLPAFTFGGTGDGLPEGISEYLRGRHIAILEDNDVSGRTHAAKKAQLASRVAASVKVVRFPELPRGGDVSDFLFENGREALERLVAETSDWTPENDHHPEMGAAALVSCDLSDVQPEKVEWLWPGRVAVGKITMIAGEPGLGKSQVSIALAAAVTVGGHWPLNGGRAPMGSVVILSAEDGLADTVRPRFDAAGGDVSRVRIVRAVQQAESTRRTFNLAADLALLEAEITRKQDVRLVLIDPVSSYLGKTDSHKNADVRSVLEPLSDMAERLRVAIVAITHLSKGDGKAINRFIGSIAFVAAARTAFAVVEDAEDSARLRRLLLPVKNNIAAKPEGLAFRLAQREVADGIIGSYVVWDETSPVTVSVDEAMAGGSPNGSERTATEEATDLLREILANGPADVLDIEVQARSAAILSDTRRINESKPFRSAAVALGVVKKRIGFGPGARIQWSLPSEHIDDEKRRGQ